MFKKLRNRLLLFNMTIISIVMIAAFAVIYFITYTNIQNENQSKLDTIPNLAIVATSNLHFQETQTQQTPGRMVIRVPIDYSPSFAILVDGNGQVVNVFSHVDMPNDVYYKIAERIWSAVKKGGTISFENRKWQYRISPFGNQIVLRDENQKVLRENGDRQFISGDNHFQIAFLDITDSSKTLTQLLITFVLVGIPMLFILFGVSFYFANLSIGPIEDNWKKQKQFVADASHELKTPLAIINANADALLANGEEAVNSQRKWIDYIQSEAGRMGKLINDMLYLAKVEDTHEDQIPFNISSTVLDVIASMEAVIFEKGISLNQTIEPDIIVQGDCEKIKQAVLILLDNATKYTNDHGDINIILKKIKNRAVFSIKNSCDGIPKDKLSRIFDRFYRIDPSRSKETGGYGLGLSIAKTVIERSGGSIYAETTESSATFTFELKIS